MRALTAGFAVLAVLLVAPRASRLPRSGRGDPRLLELSYVAVGLLTLCLLAFSGVSPVLIGLALATEAAVVRAVRRRSRRAAADRRRERVLFACEGLAADLVAGLGPLQALQSMSAEWPEIKPVADTAAVGGDVPQAFRVVAELPGASQLRVAAAAWSVGHRTGAGLAETVGFAAMTVHAQRATARVVATELAAAMATARLLALLPAGILVLGRGLGGDPFAFLFESGPGQVCLTLGLGLGWIGGAWLERIAEQVESP